MHGGSFGLTRTEFSAIKCPNNSDLINVILPYLICIGFVDFVRVFGIYIDGKQVDLNVMDAVIVKCFDCIWKVGSESD